MNKGESRKEKNMKKKLCFLYTGQGSQYFGMCKNYYTLDQEFASTMRYLDDIVIQQTGCSVINYMYTDNHRYGDIFDDIEYTHLAICMVEYAMTKSLISKGIIPDALIGCSLGEYVCMAVSGQISVEDLIRFLIDQAKFIKNQFPAGGMLAVLDNVSNYNMGFFEEYNIDVASVNYDKHFIISGSLGDIYNIKNILKREQTEIMDLPVRYGFHSRSIDSIHDAFLENLEPINFYQGNIPLISSSQVAVVDGYDKNMLWQVIRKSIRFKDTLLNYCSDEDIALIDVGPSGTLAGFSKNILNRKEGIFGIISPFHTEGNNIKKIMQWLADN